MKAILRNILKIHLITVHYRIWPMAVIFSEMMCFCLSCFNPGYLTMLMSIWMCLRIFSLMMFFIDFMFSIFTSSARDILVLICWGVILVICTLWMPETTELVYLP